MFKRLLCVTLLLALVLNCECLFPGDSCVAEERPGVCKLLSLCTPLIKEIQKAGGPMPSHLRQKLKDLGCGFQSLEPLVCCASFPNDNPDIGSNRPSKYPWSTQNSDAVTQDPWSSTGSNIGNKRTDRPKPNGNQNSHNPPRSTPNIASNTNSGSPPSIQGHRNLDLLPNDCGPFSDDFKIWGGNKTFLFEMPWMVLIAYDSSRGTKLSCGGTLITERHVLTAAHCVSFLGNRLTLSGVVLGEYDTRSDPDCERQEGELHCASSIRNVSIEKVIAHPGYSPQNLVDDIAILKLSEPADFTLENMKPICLPNTADLQATTLVGQISTVAGWGATEDGLQSPVLLKVDLPIVSNKDCQDAYNGTPRIYNRQLCAGGVEDKDSCGGDSGGPLMYAGRVRSGKIAVVQHGVVSYGPKRCGLGGYPGVYTRISYYMDWILDNIAN